MAVVHPRTLIREYTMAMLRAEIEINNRVFSQKPNAVIIKQLPCICVYFIDEPVTIFAGDVRIPKTYERVLNIAIDVVAEKPVGDETIETKLDTLAREVEDAMKDDVFYQKRLSGYTGNLKTDDGLIAGMRLTRATPYDIVDEHGEITAGAQSLVYELPYLDDAYVEHKYEIMTSWLMEIRRVGWDDETVDPVLIAAEGDLTE